MKRWAPLAWIVLAGATVFGPVTTAYFCGYDDFTETHRAAFEDSREPARIFTTTHWGTSKYRPLNRWLTYVCWLLGRGSALPLRVRNLFFHVVAALLIYAVALLATKDVALALGSGLLFVIHPLADQNVAAAIFTNTTSYALMLASFYLFQRSLQGKKLGLLAASFFTLFVALFFYEAVIVALGMMVLYLLVWKVRGQQVSTRYAATFGSGCAVVLLAYALVRHAIVSVSTPLVPFGQIAKNVVMYAAALINPVDTVLANSLLGTPLPPDIQISRQLIAAVAAIGIFLFLVALLALRVPRVRARLARLDWTLAGFLVLSIAAALAPFLAFAPHASETYLYLPAALFSILLCLILRGLLSMKGYSAAVAVLALLFGAASWERNQRVSSCGAIARNIVSELPVAQWKQGDRHIRLQGEPSALRRYGIYGYEGLSTIDVGDPSAHAAQAAVQIATGNDRIQVDVVSPAEADRGCPALEECFSISREGGVRPVSAQ